MENREIDFLIFEHVFGNERGYIEYLKQQAEELQLNLSIIKRYSSDIKYAWLVVEKLKLTVTPTYDGWEVFRSNTSRSERDCKYIGTTNNQTWVKHDSAPMAICLAALKSVGINIEN